MKTIIALSLLSVATIVTAHPGRTASDGCHYCRTNCGSWGVTAGARHCHGNKASDELRIYGRAENTEQEKADKGPVQEVEKPAKKVEPVS